MGDRFDILIAGGGLAGLSLALHLKRSPLGKRSILIVDKGTKDCNDRTWGFWTNQSTIYDDIVYRTWRQVQFVSEDFEKIGALQDYCYKMVRGIDFYRFARQELAADGNVEFLQGRVERIQDGKETAVVSVDGKTYTADWAFDSRFNPASLRPGPSHYHHLNLHFRGWEIETTQDVFDPEVMTLLDFRTPQKGDARFFYILPFSARRALVEYTLFTSGRSSRDESEPALREYLRSSLGVQDYRVIRAESGLILATDQPFPRRGGCHIMNIGTRAGRVKPTTGYAFTRIQQDSAAIVASLLRFGHPFAVPKDSARYQLYDTILLQIMYRHGEQVKPIFTELFKNNPFERVLRFLDEAAPLKENLRLIATLPPQDFIQALLRVKVLHQI
jgi:lycopene beta-cyclase